MEPKFCKPCGELVYSRLCPYCERPAGAMDYGAEAAEAEVDEGGAWGSDLDGSEVLSFDEVFGTESDD